MTVSSAADPAFDKLVPEPESDRWIELDRLRALASYEVMDSEAEVEFDELTVFAANICATPMALVGLIDADRQWYKSRLGVEAVSTPRELTFCEYALRGTDLLVVPDTHLDPRFDSHPMVTGDPHLRFYAGAPLVTPEGHVLGTLCVLDDVPRDMTDLQLAHLRILAAQVVNQLEIRRQARRLVTAVAAREAADVALREQQRMLAGVLHHTDVLVYAKDLEGRFVMTNAALELITQVEGGLIGRTDHDLFEPDTADVYRRNDRHMLASGERQIFTEDLAHPDGSTHTYRSTKFPIVDDLGVVIGIGGVSTDITELAAARAALEQSAATDPLTGSLNRRAWHDRLEALIAAATDTGAPLTIAVIDLDNFKAYNDSHGHNTGDALLQAFATAAVATLLPTDVFARWGGEEFVVALPGTNLQQAAQILDRLRAAVPADQTCSIGYSAWRPEESVDDTLTRADVALYTAKRLGRNRVAEA